MKERIKLIKNKKSIISLILLIIIGIVGAFYSATELIHNHEYQGKKFAYQLVYDSKSDRIKWTTGDRKDFIASLTNTGDIDFAVRFKVHETWKYVADDSSIDRNGTDPNKVLYDNKMFVVSTEHWTHVTDYYYYDDIVTPGNKIEKFIDHLINDTTNVGILSTRVNTYDINGEELSSEITYEDGDKVYYILKLEIDICEKGYDWAATFPVATPAQYFSYNVLPNDTIKITGYNVAGGESVVIPDEISGKEVSTIGEEVFSNIEVSNVMVSSKVKTIESKAFAANPTLEKVSFSTTNNLNNLSEDILESTPTSIKIQNYFKEETELETFYLGPSDEEYLYEPVILNEPNASCHWLKEAFGDTHSCYHVEKDSKTHSESHALYLNEEFVIKGTTNDYHVSRCSKCGYIRIEKWHNHLIEEWITDDATHSHGKCECGYEFGYHEHLPNSEGKCCVCGATVPTQTETHEASGELIVEYTHDKDDYCYYSYHNCSVSGCNEKIGYKEFQHDWKLNSEYSEPEDDYFYYECSDPNCGAYLELDHKLSSSTSSLNPIGFKLSTIPPLTKY